MAQHNKEKKTRNFRLTLVDDKTHKHLWTAHITRVSFIVYILSILVMLGAASYCIIAYTPIRTFIPGYPDAHSKRAAIQNAIRIDSLENVIYRWELYSENLKRVVEGKEPLKIDSLINAAQAARTARADAEELLKKDSLLRDVVREEEEFGISARSKRDLPIEGLHFFTPIRESFHRDTMPTSIHMSTLLLLRVLWSRPHWMVQSYLQDGTKTVATSSRFSMKATSFRYTSITRNCSRR